MVSVYSYSKSNEYLKSVLEAKKELNKSFSLRSAARYCGLSPAALSTYLNGKKNISVQLARQISLWLKLEEKEQEYFVKMVEFETSRSSSIKKVLLQRLEELADEEKSRRKDTSRLNYDFVFSKWFYLPLLILLKTSELNHKSNAELAEFLDVSYEEMDKAIEQFQEAGIAQLKDQRWVVNDELLFVSDGPHLGLRKFHHIMLTKAQESLHSQNNDEKFVGSETMLFNKESLPLAREIMEECFNRMLLLSAKVKSSNSLYHLGINFFRISKK
jgi:uncharacterized protein (TIGR02147 family)